MMIIAHAHIIHLLNIRNYITALHAPITKNWAWPISHVTYNYCYTSSVLWPSGFCPGQPG